MQRGNSPFWEGIGRFPRQGRDWRDEAWHGFAGHFAWLSKLVAGGRRFLAIKIMRAGVEPDTRRKNVTGRETFQVFLGIVKGSWDDSGKPK